MMTPWAQFVFEFCVRANSDDEWSTVLAESERDAAERYVEMAEGPDTEPGRQLVQVRSPESTTWKTYRVDVEAVWAYHAEAADVD